LGLRPAPVGRCRVLEIGCAGGGNLLPMALTLPGSTFLGIDLSARQVEEGQKVVSELALKNVTLEHRSVLSVGEADGLFDYIICHGVYSWVPPPVQENILQVCSRNLGPNGVAYVSYNTYPGWHMRGLIRDMMCYHSRHAVAPEVRVGQARKLLDFLAKSVARENSPYSLLLQSELDMVSRQDDSYLFHEHLEDVNEPLYFHQFVDRAAAKGLRYLGEADFQTMVPGNFPPEVESVLQVLSPDNIHLEQYMDFLRNRLFRQTLLCHAKATPRYTLHPRQLAAFHVASAARPVSEQPDLASAAPESFRGPHGFVLTSSDPHREGRDGPPRRTLATPRPLRLATRRRALAAE